MSLARYLSQKKLVSHVTKAEMGILSGVAVAINFIEQGNSEK